jgi:uncharacterized cupredoxin-like copper-binding protein
MRRAFAVPIVCSLTVAMAPFRGSAQEVRPQSVSVTANDYAFLALPEIKSGSTIFSFSNQGKVTHEMFIVQLKSGVSVDEYMKASNDPFKRREMSEEMVGILLAGPGKTPSGKLLVDLAPGATYVVACNMRDKPDAPGHLTYGMLTSFTIK